MRDLFWLRPRGLNIKSECFVCTLGSGSTIEGPNGLVSHLTSRLIQGNEDGRQRCTTGSEIYSGILYSILITLHYAFLNVKPPAYTRGNIL